MASVPRATFRDGFDACSADEAVERALLVLEERSGQYILGTGNYKPYTRGGKLIDRPWTTRDGKSGSDCAGFAICWCYKLRRYRPGFADNGKLPEPFTKHVSNVDEHINCNSALEDALTTRELFEFAKGAPRPGDLLVYPTLYIRTIDEHGEKDVKKFIGHVGIVTGVSRVRNWKSSAPRYDQLDIAQCKGPNGRRPAVVATDGSGWMRHDEIWPKLQHRTHVLRAAVSGARATFRQP